MKILFGCSLANTMGRETVEEMCCLHALGELSVEAGRRWEDHLGDCESCRALTRVYKRIMFFDLPAIAVAQSDDNVGELLSGIDEDRLLANIHERASAARERQKDQFAQVELLPRISSGKDYIRSATITAAVGWTAAAILLLSLTGRKPSPRPEHEAAMATPLAAAASDAGKTQIDAAERRAKEFQSQLLQAKAQIRGFESEHAHSTLETQNLVAANSTLESRLQEQQASLTQEGAVLGLTRQQLKDEIAAGDGLRSKLTDVYDRLEKERGEAAKLERVAASAPAHFALSDQSLGESEAKEILGARDLHIVDVYDVDSSGNSSRSYGRIYFVNRSELIFYAFDLSKLESGHKVVAFQAWGFRQPQSSTAESLGLFYLDNATLNRWTLRISDPQVLSRIDSLFVTVEPPGGSRSPKGRRLLMASLAGPPNHP